MAEKAAIRQQVQIESAWRARLGVPAIAGGFLYMISAIINASTRSGGPTVGLIEGLTPALKGEAVPRVSPATGEIKYISHDALGLIAGGLMFAIAIVILMFVLLLLIDATKFRRPKSWSFARQLVIGGAAIVAVATLAEEVIEAIKAHEFAVGHNFSGTAAEHVTSGTATQIALNLGLIAALALGIGMVGVSLNALRVGLLPRWMGILGMIGGITIFLPVGDELQVLLAFWLVMTGVLYGGRWPKQGRAETGDPPAWAAGEAIPWPPRGGGRRFAGAGAGAGGAVAAADIGPAPAPAPRGSAGSSRKRRRGPGPRS